MNGSWKIARFAGIDVSVHWTFLLLIGWVFFSTALSGASVPVVLFQTTFVLAVFGCVLLHEFGHAFAARYFGIPTHGITLLPIGGVAQLDRIPRKPMQEFVIAIAGPAVNVAIASLLLFFTQSASLTLLRPDVASMSQGWLELLLKVNVGLVLFNMLPAFPMDGGRVLRAILASFNNYESATRVAARVGQVVAAMLFAFGLFNNPMLMLVAGFVAFAGEAEYRSVVAENRRVPYATAVTDVLEAKVNSAGVYQAHWGSNQRPVSVRIVTPRPTSSHWAL